MRLSDFEVLSFDCYGTLIDWESGLITAYAGLRAKAGIPAQGPERDKLLEAHARHESTQQQETPSRPYPHILEAVHAHVAHEYGVAASAGENAAFGASVGSWPAFADSAEALSYLQQHFRLAILSNVDRASFARSEQKLGLRFDYVFTAEDIGSYKPDSRNFSYLLSKLAEQGYLRHNILHVAESLYHDHQPANRAGLASAWIHRRHAQQGHGATRPPGEMPRYDFRFTSLTELTEAHRAETSGAL